MTAVLCWFRRRLAVSELDVQFFGTGIAATAVVVAIAASFAFASLVMSALDHVLAAQRALATLAVHGGDDKVVVAAIAAQFAGRCEPSTSVQPDCA